MAKAEKRYYWIRLMTDFFRPFEIKKLRRLGDTCVIIYIKMMLMSANSQGKIRYRKIEDDLAGELAIELDEDEDLIRKTIELLIQTELLIQISDTEYQLTQVPSLVGSETEKAAEMRDRRNNKAQAEKAEEEQKEDCVITELSEEEQCYNNVPTMFSNEEQCSTENREENREENRREDLEETRLERDYEQNSQSSVPEEKTGEVINDFECQKVMNLFNKKCPSLERAVNLTESRKDKIRYLLAKYAISDIEKVFDKAEKSPFLSGKISPTFKANFDFLLTVGHFVQVLSGYYDKYTGRDSPKGSSQHEDDMRKWEEMAQTWANS